MSVERIISRVAEYIPLRIKVALRGERSSPNRLANIIHSFLNRLAAERYPILPCGGVLKGFRMRVDWQLHRSFAYGSWEPEVVGQFKSMLRRVPEFWISAHRADFIPSFFPGLLGPVAWSSLSSPFLRISVSWKKMCA